MPLNQNSKLILNTNPIEHRGGDGWTILHGDMLNIIQSFEPGVFDAVITDPPYASGGSRPHEKNRTTNQKYSSMEKENALPDFDGDQKDQRSWTNWMAQWLSDVRRVCKEGAPICLFIDWRQLPSLTDALQWAGWIWRGVAVWDKLTSRPQKGRFRQQSEFIVWGSNGPMPVNRPVGWPEAARAVTRAQGPGMVTTGMPCWAHRATSSSPGSEMAGIPASVTRAQFSPASSRSSTAWPPVSVLWR